jgi:hypothetical protein
MNFITYINKQGVFKTAECAYDPLRNSIATISPINENYLVTSVYVDSKKRKVSDVYGVSAVQLAVINDDNFDGNLLDENHYSLEGTRFIVGLLPLDSVGVGGGVSPVVQVSNFPYFKKINVSWFTVDSLIDFGDLPDFAKKLLLNVSHLGGISLPVKIWAENRIYRKGSQVFVNSCGYGVASSDVFAYLDGEDFFVPAGMPFFFNSFIGRERLGSDGGDSYFTGFVCGK